MHVSLLCHCMMQAAKIRKNPEPRGLTYPFWDLSCFHALRSGHASSMRLFAHRIQNLCLKKKTTSAISPYSRYHAVCYSRLGNIPWLHRTRTGIWYYIVLIRAFTTYFAHNKYFLNRDIPSMSIFVISCKRWSWMFLARKEWDSCICFPAPTIPNLFLEIEDCRRYSSSVSTKHSRRSHVGLSKPQCNSEGNSRWWFCGLWSSSPTWCWNAPTRSF